MQARRKKSDRTRAMTPIGDALRRWLKDARARERAADAPDGRSVFDAWKRVVGEDIAARTRVIEWRGGELLVEVSSQILESLRDVEELRAVHRLRFRAGSF
jgi:hypothetical protein